MSSNSTKNITIIGYSGHGFVATDVFLWQGVKVVAYCDREEKEYNPFSLQYLGRESDPRVIARLNEYDYFVAIGENSIAKRLHPIDKGVR